MALLAFNCETSKVYWCKLAVTHMMHLSSVVSPSATCTTDEVIETGVVKKASHVAQLVVLSLFLLAQ